MTEVIEKYDQLNFNIVLVEPEIPNNTGCIGRTCVATKSRLHLVKPLGFEINDTRVKRAGLDYWDDLELVFHDSFEDWYKQVEDKSRIFFFTSRTAESFYKVELKEGDWLVFGKESKGLGEAILTRFQNQLVGLPFPGKVRSFNISNAVAMAVGEGLRQFSLK